MGEDNHVSELFTTGDGDAGETVQRIFKEDLDDIRKVLPQKLLFYTTVFHPESVQSIENGASIQTWDSVRSSTDTSQFRFGDNPVFDSSEKKINLEGGNYMEGPMTNALGITDPTKFTVVMVVNSYSLATWLGTDLSSAPQNTDAELFQMFGATDDVNDTNLLKVSFTTENSTPTEMNSDGISRYTGIKIRIRYSNEERVTPEFPIASDETYMYAFVVTQGQTPTVTIKRASLHSRSLAEIADFTAPATVRHIKHLLNKGITFNAQRLLEMHLYNFAIFDAALDDGQLSTLLDHFSNNFDPADTRCPYDDATCYSDECIGIDDWSVPTALINAPACRGKVNEFCKNNPSHPECMCWDPEDGNYDKLKCKLWRAYISGDPDQVLNIQGLTAEQVAEIRQHHNLVTEEAKNQAVQAAKDLAEKGTRDALESEKKKLINYYENAPGTSRNNASDGDGDGDGDDDDDDDGVGGQRDGSAGTGAVNYWKNPSGADHAPDPTVVRSLVDPYTDKTHAPSEEGIGVKKVRRLRDLEEDEGEPKSGLFNWFRRWIAG
eukprot:jgi/Tetstr1/447269/TSEL_034706.t1